MTTQESLLDHLIAHYYIWRAELLKVSDRNTHAKEDLYQDVMLSTVKAIRKDEVVSATHLKAFVFSQYKYSRLNMAREEKQIRTKRQTYKTFLRAKQDTADIDYSRELYKQVQRCLPGPMQGRLKRLMVAHMNKSVVAREMGCSRGSVLRAFYQDRDYLLSKLPTELVNTILHQLRK